MSRVCCVLELSTYLCLILDMCLIKRLGHSAVEGEETVSVPISGVFILMMTYLCTCVKIL